MRLAWRFNLDGKAYQTVSFWPKPNIPLFHRGLVEAIAHALKCRNSRLLAKAEAADRTSVLWQPEQLVENNRWAAVCWAGNCFEAAANHSRDIAIFHCSFIVVPEFNTAVDSIMDLVLQGRTKHGDGSVKDDNHHQPTGGG